MSPTQDIVHKYLTTHINFYRFAKMVCAIGTQFNDSQKRFQKGQLIEESFAECSNGKLKYVGLDSRGCDFIIPELNDTKLEMKFDALAIYSKKMKLRKHISVKLMNSHGTNKHMVLPENYAEYLLIASNTGVLLISTRQLRIERYINIEGDGITAKFPTSKATLLIGPDVMDIKYHNTFDYSHEQRQLTRKFFQSIY